MRNFIQRGENITVPAPAPTNSGDGVQIGNLFGVAAGTVDTGEDLDLVTVGVFRLPKHVGDEVDIGDVLYWDEDELTIDDGGTAEFLAVGVAVEDAAGAATTIAVRLSV